MEDYYQRIQKSEPSKQLRNIDEIYLINLASRPERWQNCMAQLDLYNIVPQRFEGIYGWNLTAEQLNDIGLIMEPWMWRGTRAPLVHFPPEKNGQPVWLRQDESSFGRAIFYGWLTKGTIGRTLSHLSILKYAMDAGYETIWVMEDEVIFYQDPHKLSSAIDQLNALVGSDGWDVLYTNHGFFVVDPHYDLMKQIHHMLRPDIPAFNPRVFSEVNTYFSNHRDLSPDFMQIAGRGGTNSIIYQRSGIKKILDFYQKHRLFTDYASELAIIPNLRLFCVKDSVTEVLQTPSDADEHNFPDKAGKIVSPWERGDPWP